MKIRILLAAVSVLLCAYTLKDGIEVHVRGALRDIMHKGDLSAKISLTELSEFPHVYGLGAVENLKGEILILDSKPYVGVVERSKVAIDSSFSKKAALLVYSQVTDWTSLAVPEPVKTMEELQAFVETTAQSKEIDVEKPFPFRLSGQVKSTDWHVIDWPIGDQVHTHEKHKKSGLHGRITNEEVHILGFYSRHHHTIFTHHTTNMHLHVKTADNVLSAHVDNLQLGKDMKIWLPK